MNDKKIREITQQSILKPSDTFTDNLMARVDASRVEPHTALVNGAWFPFLVVYSACFLLLMLLAGIAIYVYRSGLEIKLPAPIIQIVITLGVFLLVKKIMLLRANFNSIDAFSSLQNG
jgi:hypothetical protein